MNYKKASEMFLELDSVYPLPHRLHLIPEYEKRSNVLYRGLLHYLPTEGDQIFKFIETLDVHPNIKEAYKNRLKHNLCRTCWGTDVFIDHRGDYICRKCHPTGK